MLGGSRDTVRAATASATTVPQLDALMTNAQRAVGYEELARQAIGSMDPNALPDPNEQPRRSPPPDASSMTATCSCVVGT
jgi:hypothetical protein